MNSKSSSICETTQETIQPPVKKRYEWIDNARIVAAFLIMYVHWRWRMGIPGSNDYETLRSFVHFSNLHGRVAFFLILAGYFLGRSATWKKALDRFFWLFVPYTLWNLIIYFSARAVGQPAESFADIFGLGHLFYSNGPAIDPSVTFPYIVPSWFLRDIMLLSLVTPLLAKLKPFLVFIILLCSSTSSLNLPFQQSLILNPTTCIFYCLGVCLSSFKIDDIYRLLSSKFTPVWLMLIVTATAYSIYSITYFGHEEKATLFGMLIGSLMIAYSGILVEKHLPRISKFVAPCGPACFLVFMLHHPILTAIRTYAPASFVDSWFGIFIPVPVFVIIVSTFLAMKKYTPWLMPYLGHMKLPKKAAKN